MTIAAKLRDEGLQKGLQQGLQQGLQKGRHEAQNKALGIARKLLSEGKSATYVSQLLELPVSQIRDLK